MPFSALPEGFKDQAKGTGTDWDNWFQRNWKKSWFAYGPRATEWWACWREYPKVLFAMFGEGYSRWESTEGQLRIKSPNNTVIMYNPTLFYLSRIQYWCRWSIQFQWPLFFAFHFYFKRPPYPSNTDGKLVFFYIGAHRDADKVYWWPSIYLGLNWK